MTDDPRSTDPEAVRLVREIARLQAALQTTCDRQAKSALAEALRDRQLKLDELRAPGPAKGGP